MGETAQAVGAEFVACLLTKPTTTGDTTTTMSENPTEDPRAKELEARLSGQKVIGGGEEADLSTSMRPGEDPEAIAREIDGIEYVRTENVKIGRLAMFDLVDDEE